MSVLSNFDRWKDFLGERVEEAVKAGMSSEKVDAVAFRLGEYLSEKVDPKNEQERLLKNMWDSSPEEDQKALARIMVNMVNKQVH